MSLFRPEAMRGQDRLHGEVSLVPPVSWQLISVFLIISIAAATAYLSIGRYARTTVIQGNIAGDRGLARAISPRSGFVSAILVADGATVAKGTPIARISSATSVDGSTLEQRRTQAIAAQSQELGGSETGIRRAAESRIDGLRADVAAANIRLSSLSDQMVQQKQMVDTARSDLDKANKLAVNGFISGHDIHLRETELATRIQGMSQLQQQVASAHADERRASNAIAQENADLSIRLGDIRRQQAGLQGDAAADAATGEITIVAAEAGTVTGLTANRGDAVGQGDVIASVVPKGSGLRAEMLMPPSAAGFVEKGQPVRISIDAFPQATYGTLTGRVSQVSRATIGKLGADGSRQEGFLVRATLDQTSIKAYGAARDLRPGMTISARVSTRSQTLLQWILDPLYAVMRR